MQGTVKTRCSCGFQSKPLNIKGSGVEPSVEDGGWQWEYCTSVVTIDIMYSKD